MRSNVRDHLCLEELVLVDALRGLVRLRAGPRVIEPCRRPGALPEVRERPKGAEGLVTLRLRGALLEQEGGGRGAPTTPSSYLARPIVVCRVKVGEAVRARVGGR